MYSALFPLDILNEVKSLNTKHIKIRHRTYEQDHLDAGYGQYKLFEDIHKAIQKYLKFKNVRDNLSH
jgi:hypothetical protein